MQNELITIANVAVRRPGSIATLEKLGIDFCCKGRQSIADACRPAGITPEELLAMTEKIEAEPGTNWQNERMSQLARFIVDAHHGFTRDILGALAPLAQKVRGRHGSAHGELNVVAKLVDQLTNELLPHMLKEEQILFPYICSVDDAEAAGKEPPMPFFGTARNPIKVMMADHDNAADVLRELRVVTNDYALPEEACASYRALFGQLVGLESDLHQHIHLENNILFPRAIDTEERTRTSAIPAALANHTCGAHRY